MSIAARFQHGLVGTKDRGVQSWRFWSQVGSLAVNVGIGVQFAIWASQIERGIANPTVNRPPGVEGWLPISSLVSLRAWFLTGEINNVHPAGLVIFLVIAASAFLFKKGFCGWICPIGFLSEVLGTQGERILKRRITPWKWLDIPLRSLKYILAGLFVYAVFRAMSPGSIQSFVTSDYNVVADILMLRFFTHISPLAVSVLVGLLLLSVLVRSFWCRYLCPYGALLGVLGLISPTRLRRANSTCTSCSACTKSCPSRIPVERVTEVVSDECVGCMACVDVCPAKKTLEIKVLTPTRTVSPKAWAIGLVAFFWGALLLAKAFGPWQNSVPADRYLSAMEAAKSGRLTHP